MNINKLEITTGEDGSGTATLEVSFDSLADFHKWFGRAFALDGGGYLVTGPQIAFPPVPNGVLEKLADAHAEKSPALNLYEGCWVTLRNGEVHGPLRFRPDAIHPWAVDGKGYSWAGYGCFFAEDDPDPRDIISTHPTDPREWIEWKGGECPVPEDTTVELHLRNGNRQTWHHSQYLRWTHLNSGDDIVAYKVLSQ